MLLLTPMPAWSAQNANADPDADQVFRIRDPRIVESSSLVVSGSDPGLAFTANDGPTRLVFAVDTGSGETVGTTTMTGIAPTDVEAMAAGPDGTLYVGDIGDNDAERNRVSVYRIAGPGRETATVRPEVFLLAYPEGPRDAEALLVHPVTGQLFVVSKELLGAHVYAAPETLSATSVNRLTEVAPISGVVTDGAFLPSGDQAVLRMYGRAGRYDVPGWRQVDSWPLPKLQQGESVAVLADGQSILVGSEGKRSPVWQVALPAGSPSTSAATPTAATESPPAAEPADDLAPSRRGLVLALVAVGVGATALVGYAVIRRRG